MKTAMAAVACAAACLTTTRAQDVFRASVDTVPVSVAVKKGNNAVVGLQAGDFMLYDNGVLQKVDAVSREDVPIDVSLFVDTSASTAGTLDEMRDSVRKIAAMLRPNDRFRLLTIGNSVYAPVPWTEAGRPLDAGVHVFGGISLVLDAVAAALLHAVPVGRRHLVVAMTDGMDCGSLVRPGDLQDLAGRTEAVLHWVVMSGAGGTGGRAVCDQLTEWQYPDVMTEASKRTGGDVHGSPENNPNPVKEFTKVFDDFRLSYVLQFTPAGVAKSGWHQLRVEVPKGTYRVHARSGYFGG
jgi:VWFA-related protein